MWLDLKSANVSLLGSITFIWILSSSSNIAISMNLLDVVCWRKRSRTILKKAARAMTDWPAPGCGCAATSTAFTQCSWRSDDYSAATEFGFFQPFASPSHKPQNPSSDASSEHCSIGLTPQPSLQTVIYSSIRVYLLLLLLLLSFHEPFDHWFVTNMCWKDGRNSLEQFFRDRVSLIITCRNLMYILSVEDHENYFHSIIYQRHFVWMN